ncbi:TIGR03663 family protein [Conexibacter sp. W3-3-2]|nr:TIGR03663 family protein [Conexibacter sp. W3-3-2]
MIPAMERLRGRIGRPEALAWGLLVLGALVLRLIDLGDRSFHHDESQIAYFSWSTITQQHTYEYNPLLHGPWQYYATALTYKLFGVSDFAARSGPALLGTLMVAMPFFVRRHIGRIAAYSAAVGLAIGPSYLYYSRFTREDIHIAAMTLAVIVIVIRMLDTPRRWHPPVLFALLAATLTVKESGLIFGFLCALFIVALLVGARVRHTGRTRAVQVALAVGWRPWVLAGLAFVLVYCAFFSSFGSHWAGIWDGIYEGPKYWIDQHDVGRGGERWYLYAGILGGYEWPVVLFGLVGAIAVLRWAVRPSTEIPGFTDRVVPHVRVLAVFLVWLFVASFTGYSIAGERFAWLILHPLLPLLLLAGIGLQVVWAGRDRVLPRVALGLLVLGLASTVYSSYRVNADDPVDPSELLVTTQSGPEIPAASQRLHDLDTKLQRSQGRRLSITIDPNDGASFPWAWYLRDLQVSYDAGVRTPGYTPSTDALVLTAGSQVAGLGGLQAYDARPILLRSGWARDWGDATPRAWWNWYFKRQAWGPLSDLDETLFIRKGL